MSSTLAELRRNPNWEAERDESPWRSRRVLLHSDGSWSDGEGDGVYCQLLPIYDPRDFEVYDALAWEPQQPRRWWRATKIAVCLGEEDIKHAWWDAVPTIKLVENPAQWLVTAPPVACILDWKTDLRSALGSIQVIECATERLARFLDKRLCAQVQHRFLITAAGKR